MVTMQVINVDLRSALMSCNMREITPTHRPSIINGLMLSAFHYA